MSVIVTQYRGSNGIFNNRNFAFRPKFTNFIGNRCWSNFHLNFKLHVLILLINLVFFVVFLIVVLSPRCSFYITLTNTNISMLVTTVALLFIHLWFTSYLLLLCGHLELNRGSNQKTAKKISICHWNRYSIAAHNFAKRILLKAHNSIHKFDIICLSETYLDSSILRV